MILGPAEIEALLPHRYPMLLVDRVRSCEPGSSIVAVKNVTRTEPCFARLSAGVGPHAYAYPCSLIMESFGQTAGLLYLLGAAGEERGPGVMLFGSASHCRFEGEAFPGDSLEHRALLERAFTDAAVFSGEVWAGDRRIVSVERMVLAIRPAQAAGVAA